MTAKSIEHWIYQLRRTVLQSQGAGLSDGQLLFFDGKPRPSKPFFGDTVPWYWESATVYSAMLKTPKTRFRPAGRRAAWAKRKVHGLNGHYQSK
jgi:hypothetical protein